MRESLVVTEAFDKWGRGFAGCDGGDPDRGIWVCGIEYAGGEDKESIRWHLTQDVSKPPPPREDHGSYLHSRYNVSVLKILCTLANEDVSRYEEFFRAKNIFGDKSGYFKLNLYPIGFRNISPAEWEESHTELTGFHTKHEYRTWCQTERFPEMKSWVQKWNPKLIICTGKTFTDDFFNAFCDSIGAKGHDDQAVPGKPIKYAITNAGQTLVAVTYFPYGGRYCLNSNANLSATGERLAQLLSLKNRHTGSSRSSP